jgi:hypothetical protein
MPMLSFRGSIASDGIQTIALHTNDGRLGYRIKKFELMGEDMNEDVEHCVKVFTVPQSAVTSTYDFSDQTLIGAAFLRVAKSTPGYNQDVVVFDNITFNQDIYVTHKDVGGSAKNCNYHIELERITLDLAQNTTATLKDIRNIV